MFSEFNQAKFAELYSEGSRNGITFTKEDRGEGVRMVNMKEIFDSGFIGNQIMERVPIDDKVLEKNELKEGDLLFGRRSLVDEGAGKCVIVSGLTEPTVFESSIIRVRINKQKADPLYYYYYFKWREGRALIKSIITGANVKGIRGSELGKITVLNPPIKIQQKTAMTLHSIDNLIRANNRRVELLERIVQLLYREWFVEFRFPGCENHKFADSELGKIPERWLIKPLRHIAEKQNEQYTDDFSNKPLLDLGRINSKTQIINVIGTPKELTTSRIIFYRKNILFGAIRPYFHKVIYAPFDGVTNTSVFVIKPKLERVPLSYLFTLLNSYECVAWATTFSSGTKMPVISWGVFKKMKVLQPTEELLEIYDNKVRPMLDMITNLTQQNFVLREIRDLLLPKLMSGEIDVSKLDINGLEN